MKRSPIKKISKKREAKMKEELLIRQQLCERAGGIFVRGNSSFICIGGRCEQCGKRPDFRGIRPHHTGIGASRKPLSLEDKMLCGKCHSAKHGIKEIESA